MLYTYYYVHVLLCRHLICNRVYITCIYWFNADYIILFIVIAIYGDHNKAVCISRKSGVALMLMLK